MSRVSLLQPDLFAAAPSEPLPTNAPPPVAAIKTLTALLAMLRAADRLPWRDAAATMAEERRALGLARAAGAEGEKLAAAILKETERLFTATERMP